LETALAKRADDLNRSGFDGIAHLSLLV
jgi:hypothetical protein